MALKILGGVVSTTVTVRFDADTNDLLLLSATAPAPIFSDMDLELWNFARSALFSASTTMLPRAAALSERDAVPASAVTFIFEPSTNLTVLLNVMDMEPLPVWYIAETNTGGPVSRIAMVRSDTAAIRLPDVSRTAPRSMSSCGVAMAFTAAVSVSFRSNVTYVEPFTAMISLDRVTPPALWLAFRT